VDLSGAAEASVTTGADGAYAFADLGLGIYELRSNGPEGWVVTTGEVVTVKIETAEQVVDNAHFGWMEETTGGMASIGGIVFHDVNGNKVQDDGMVPTRSRVWASANTRSSRSVPRAGSRPPAMN
jgi:hypothetical protein